MKARLRPLSFKVGKRSRVRVGRRGVSCSTRIGPVTHTARLGGKSRTTVKTPLKGLSLIFGK